jgi:hypothetical protein
MNQLRLGVVVLAGLAWCLVGVARGQTSVAASVYGSFGGTANGNNVQQSPSNAAGVLFEVRHISNPLVGYEATYSYNRDDQSYKYTGPISAIACNPSPCPGQPSGPLSIPANAHEVTGDYIVSLPVANFRPFLLVGGGILFNQPSGSSSGAESATKGVLVYGGGVDWTMLPHLGIRGQYRGNVFKAPDLTTAFSSTGAFMHTAQPMIGAYLKF